jgi:hypothetical protein
VKIAACCFLVGAKRTVVGGGGVAGRIAGHATALTGGIYRETAGSSCAAAKPKSGWR